MTFYQPQRTTSSSQNWLMMNYSNSNIISNFNVQHTYNDSFKTNSALDTIHSKGFVESTLIIMTFLWQPRNS